MENYSPQDLEIVQRINGADNYYEVLELSKDCSDEDVRKAYKGLALKVHPDKNHAPASTKAFQALSNACRTLCDPRSRQEYDRSLEDVRHTTSEDGRRDDRPTRQRQRDEHEGHWYMSAEEAEAFYRAFFEAAKASRKARETEARSKTKSFILVYLSLLGLMLMIGVFFVTPKTRKPTKQLPVRPAEKVVVPPTADYSLQRDSDFAYMRKTASLGVIYFVPRNSRVFRDHSATMKIDKEVENEYVTGLQNKCKQETAAAAGKQKTRLRSCERLRSLNVGT